MFDPSYLNNPILIISNNMKTLTLFLFLGVFALTFTSCNNDDDGGSSSIVGLWEVLTIQNSNCNDPTDNADLDLENMPCEPDGLGGEVCTAVTMNFESNGNLTFTFDIQSLLGNFTLTEDFTYTTSGNNVTICSGNDCSTGSWSVNGGVLTMEYQDPLDGCDSNITARK
jgi:hypothetical protein